MTSPTGSPPGTPTGAPPTSLPTALPPPQATQLPQASAPPPVSAPPAASSPPPVSTPTPASAPQQPPTSPEPDVDDVPDLALSPAHAAPPASRHDDLNDILERVRKRARTLPVPMPTGMHLAEVAPALTPSETLFGPPLPLVMPNATVIPTIPTIFELKHLGRGADERPVQAALISARGRGATGTLHASGNDASNRPCDETNGDEDERVAGLDDGSDDRLR